MQEIDKVVGIPYIFCDSWVSINPLAVPNVDRKPNLPTGCVYKENQCRDTAILNLFIFTVNIFCLLVPRLC